MTSASSGYFRNHWTMSEWFSASERRQQLIAEDGSKRERLGMLREVMNVPSVASVAFPYAALIEKSADFAEFVAEAGNTAFALRLTPNDGNGEVLRQRGRPLPELLEWALTLGLDGDNYSCSFERHVESASSAIFVCNSTEVWGEFHAGPLLELNRGGMSEDVRSFCVDWSSVGTRVPKVVEAAVTMLRCPNDSARKLLSSEIEAKFHQENLLGYFEVIVDQSSNLWFVDYNRLLVESCPWSVDQLSSGRTTRLAVKGRTGSRGRVRGTVVHAGPPSEASDLSRASVLVTHATTPEMLPQMARAAGVVTEVGGVLSHAAIACRELGIPCLVGAADATSRLQEGQLVELDADAGIVTVL